MTDPKQALREPTEAEILAVMDSLLGFSADELKSSENEIDQLTLRRTRIEAERACRAFIAASEALAEGPGKPVAYGWIACADRMPEHEDEVFVAVMVDGRQGAYITVDSFVMQTERPLGYGPSVEIDMDWQEHEFEEITHWMDKPPLYASPSIPSGLIAKEEAAKVCDQMKAAWRADGQHLKSYGAEFLAAAIRALPDHGAQQDMVPADWRETLLDVTNALSELIDDKHPYAKIVAQARAMLDASEVKT